jgi:hypothetical protein
MKAYIQTDKEGEFYNVNAFIAYEGFKHFGFEIGKFHAVEDIMDDNPENVMVGGIGNVRKRLAILGIERNKVELDYPKALEGYLKRRVWRSTLEEILKANRRNIFIKPEVDTKKFAGKVFKNDLDFVGLIDVENPTRVLCSDIVDFRAEFRCFIRYKEILDVRRYKGAWDRIIDLAVVKNAIADFVSQPAAYALDFGVDAQNETLLVEVNDGHSLGSYGMSSGNYARFLSARWAELTGTSDYLNF